LSARGRLFLYRVLFGLALLGLWEGASGRLIDPFWISSPTKVFAYLAEMGELEGLELPADGAVPPASAEPASGKE